MTIAARFDSTCSECNGAIKRGSSIVWYKGSKSARHTNCAAATPRDPNAVVAPCWICKAPEGRFRNYGPAMPVYCDACEIKARFEHRKANGSGRYDCPTCKRRDVLTSDEAKRGYQCRDCTAIDES